MKHEGFSLSYFSLTHKVECLGEQGCREEVRGEADACTGNHGARICVPPAVKTIQSRTEVPASGGVGG